MKERICIRCGVVFFNDLIPKKVNGNTRICRECYLTNSRRKWKTFYYKHKNEENIRSREKYLKLKDENHEHLLEMDKKHYNTVLGCYNYYKKNARRKNREFSLTKDIFYKYWMSNCYYCGNILKKVSFDRVDNNIGYIESNVVPCCWMCNTKKRKMNQIDFINKHDYIKRRFLPSPNNPEYL